MPSTVATAWVVVLASILSTTITAQPGGGPKPAGQPDESLIVLPQPAGNPPG